MKRFFLLCMIISAFTTNLQGAEEHKLWSIKAGVNFANFTNLDYTSKFQSGFNVGINRMFRISKQLPLHLQGGVALEMKGAKITGGISQESQLKSYSIEIPIVIRYDISLSKSSSIHPFVGLYYSLALSGNLESGGESINPYIKEEVALDPLGDPLYARMFSRSDVGIRVGMDYKYTNYSIGIAYDAGLTNVYATEYRDRNYKASSGCVSINVGYYF